MRDKSGFQTSVAVMNQGGAVDRAAKSDASITDVKCECDQNVTRAHGYQNVICAHFVQNVIRAPRSTSIP